MATHFAIAALAAIGIGLAGGAGAIPVAYNPQNAPAFTLHPTAAQALPSLRPANPVGLSAVLLLAQAPMAATPQGQHPAGPHLDNQPGDTPVPHNPQGSANRADGGGAAAHLHNQGDGFSSHRPGAAPSAAGGTGAPALIDNQPGDGPRPNRPGRGAP